MSDDRLASMHHGDPATLGGVFFGELWRGRDNLRVSFRRPVSARAIVTAMLPLAQMATMTASAAMALAAPWAGTGLLGGALAAAAIAPTVLRTAVMTRRAAPRGPGPATLAGVAVAYDAGRAAALLVRARHATRRRG